MAQNPTLPAKQGKVIKPTFGCVRYATMDFCSELIAPRISQGRVARQGSKQKSKLKHIVQQRCKGLLLASDLSKLALHSLPLRARKAFCV